VHVTIDKAGQYQVAANIQDRHAVRQRSRGVVAEGCDTPTSDPDIYQAPIGEPAMGVRRAPWVVPRCGLGREA
jgi:hypothetical protein